MIGQTRTIMESGVEVATAGDGTTTVLSSDGCRLHLKADEIRCRHGIRPVVSTTYSPREWVRILRPEEERDVPVSRWWNALRMQGVSDGWTAAHYVDEVAYRFVSLARAYADATVACARECELREHLPPSGELFLGEDGPHAVYEFGAFVSAVWRCLTFLRRPLWHLYGGRGSMPASLEAVLKCSNDVPGWLREAHSASSQAWDDAKQYRDCLEHHVPVCDTIQGVSLVRLPDGLWTARMLIADNPGTKSRSQFSFSETREALSWSWHLTVRLADFADKIAEALDGDTGMVRSYFEDA